MVQASLNLKHILSFSRFKWEVRDEKSVHQHLFGIAAEIAIAPRDVRSLFRHVSCTSTNFFFFMFFWLAAPISILLSRHTNAHCIDAGAISIFVGTTRDNFEGRLFFVRYLRLSYKPSRASNPTPSFLCSFVDSHNAITAQSVPPRQSKNTLLYRSITLGYKAPSTHECRRLLDSST